MTMRTEIDEAIAWHIKWGLRLKEAIGSGIIDISEDDAARDDACKFGMWLYGSSIPDFAKNSSEYLLAVDLHKRFHKYAAVYRARFPGH